MPTNRRNESEEGETYAENSVWRVKLAPIPTKVALDQARDNVARYRREALERQRLRAGGPALPVHSI